MRVLIIAASALLLIGCATSPISSEDAKPVPESRLSGYQETPQEPFGTLTVTRDTGAFGSACSTSLFIDGKQVAEMGTGEVATFRIPDGSVILGAGFGGALCSLSLKEREVEIIHGETKRYRVSIDGTGSMDLSPTAM